MTPIVSSDIIIIYSSPLVSMRLSLGLLTPHQDTLDAQVLYNYPLYLWVLETWIWKADCNVNIFQKKKGGGIGRISTYFSYLAAVQISINRFKNHSGSHFVEIKGDFYIKYYILM